jgi:hypothetical protein
MENLPPEFNPKRPYTIADLQDGTSYLVIPEDTLQLQVDTLNVYEGRVSIETFDPERQELIRNYYRFSANRQNTRSPKIAKRTTDTFDLI